jgi:hypothetical protein
MYAPLIDLALLVSASLFLLAVAFAGVSALPWSPYERERTLRAFQLAGSLIQRLASSALHPAQAAPILRMPEAMRWQFPATTPTSTGTWHGVTTP